MSENNNTHETNAAGEGPNPKQHGPFNIFGGPHYKGDPEDKRLRIAEKDLMIGKMRRDRAYELCDDVVQVFMKCANTGSFNLIIRGHCKEEKANMNNCLVNTFHDPKLKEQVVNKYLELRTEYRRSGLSMKERDEIKRYADAIKAGKRIGPDGIEDKKAGYNTWETSDNI